MAGKGLLILVIGFTIIFLVVGFFWGGLSSRSMDNHVSYYKNTIAHNIAVSGANISLRNVMENISWNAGLSNLDFENGKINVTVAGNDTHKTITSTGTFMGVNKIVQVKLLRGTYAKYAWFTASVSTGSKNKRTWITGDTVWGGYQSNQFLNIQGDPVFFGKVTISKGIVLSPGSNPQFLGGLQTGVIAPFSKTINYNDAAAAASEGQSLGGQCYFNGINLWLTFNNNGTVTYRTAARSAGDDSSKYSAPITMFLSAIAPKGVIYLDKGDIYLSGTLSGKITVVSDQSSGTGGGNVYLVNDMVYATRPMLPDGNGGYSVNNSCTDMMGIMATNNIDISSSVKSGGYINNIVNKDINVDAAIFCSSGGFNLEGLGTSINTPTGTINLFGSMTAGKEEMVSIYSGNTLTAGYNRHVVLDERLLTGAPVYFPLMPSYEIISWLE